MSLKFGACAWDAVGRPERDRRGWCKTDGVVCVRAAKSEGWDKLLLRQSIDRAADCVSDVDASIHQAALYPGRALNRQIAGFGTGKYGVPVQSSRAWTFEMCTSM